MSIQFSNKINVNEKGCWVWSGAKNSDGYGTIIVGDKVYRAHQISYKLFKGQLRQGREIDHLCSNRACINPEHLEQVTHKENCRRGKVGETSKKRQLAKTHCRNGHEYTKENTYTDPKLYAQQKSPSRHCITCKYEAHKKWRNKKRAQNV